MAMAVDSDLAATFDRIDCKLDILIARVNEWKKGATRRRKCYGCGKKFAPNFYLLRGKILGFPIESLVRQWNDPRVEILCCKCLKAW